MSLLRLWFAYALDTVINNPPIENDVNRERTADGSASARLRKFPPPRAKMSREIRQGETPGKGPETTQFR
ncbi:hypothetical protein TALC_00493 [Thermoplasmatales archaeon BRNA1]|nr:hypothetical protein TALC_00493 [Thermoplasmatales archaeon BRNA1]